MTVGESEVLAIYSNRFVQLLQEACRRKIQNEKCTITNTFEHVDLQNMLSDSSIRHSSASDSEDGEENRIEEAGEHLGIGEKRLERGRDCSSSGMISKNCADRAEISNKFLTQKKLGSPPMNVITLGLDVENTTKKEIATVLQLPSVLSERNDGALYGLYKLSHQLSSSGSSSRNLILVLTLQSGRFAAGLFHKGQCIKHTTSTRYTTRKGQGGAQSSNDNAKGKANSVGSQLRRAGEVQLRQDVASTFLDWENEIKRCSLYFVSISKHLQKGFWDDALKLFGNSLESGFHKKSTAVKSIPLDVGRPSFEGVVAIYHLMTTCSVQQIDFQHTENENRQQIPVKSQRLIEEGVLAEKKVDKKCAKAEPMTPLTPLHLAARDGDISELQSLLAKMDHTDDQNYDASICDIDERAGVDNMTALHFAASAKKTHLAAKCVFSLLVDGHANPCALDSRNRLPYFLSVNDNIRNAFRKARSELGEDIWRWDDAKIGPPLSQQDVIERKKKASEKKRRQRQKQKERKATKKAETLELEKKAALEAKLGEEEVKKSSDTIKSKRGRKCDFCGVVKLQSHMFHRLDHYYCSTDCVKRHQRELMAAAAVARLGSSK